MDRQENLKIIKQLIELNSDFTIPLDQRKANMNKLLKPFNVRELFKIINDMEYSERNGKNGRIVQEHLKRKAGIFPPVPGAK